VHRWDESDRGGVVFRVFSVRIGLGVAVAGAVSLSAVESAGAQGPGPGPWQQYASPESAGFAAEGLLRAREYADSVRSGAVMTIHRGRVVAAWGDVLREFELHSVRKSLVNALYGIAVEEGSVDLDRTLADAGIDDDTPLTAGEKQARIRDVIAARSGVYLNSAYAASDQDDALPARNSATRGTRFFYNNWDFNVAGVIIERTTGENLYELFDRSIAEPLGMEDWQPDDGFLVYEPTNSRHPAQTFRMSTRDLARIGQLYLDRGSWNATRILPPSWIDDSTRPSSDFGDGTGYGFMWWTYRAGSLGERYAHLRQYEAFAGQGTGGQLLLVVPDAQLVFVHRGDTDNGRSVSGRDVWTIAEMILAARTGETDANAPLEPLDPVPFASQAPARARPDYVALDREQMERIAGDYDIAPDVVARAFVAFDRLFMNFPGQGEAELLALNESEFTIMPVAGVRIIFERDADGNVTGFQATIGPQRVSGQKRRTAAQ
jgi:CubicO group peptidase (beta-lactamase class C family)